MREFVDSLDIRYIITNSPNIIQRVLNIIQQYNAKKTIQFGRETYVEDLIGFNKGERKECGLYSIHIYHIDDALERREQFEQELKQLIEQYKIEPDETYEGDRAIELWEKLERDTRFVEGSCDPDGEWGYEWRCNCDLMIYHEYSYDLYSGEGEEYVEIYYIS